MTEIYLSLGESNRHDYQNNHLGNRAPDLGHSKCLKDSLSGTVAKGSCKACSENSM